MHIARAHGVYIGYSSRPGRTSKCRVVLHLVRITFQAIGVYSVASPAAGLRNADAWHDGFIREVGTCRAMLGVCNIWTRRNAVRGFDLSAGLRAWVV